MGMDARGNTMVMASNCFIIVTSQYNQERRHPLHGINYNINYNNKEKTGDYNLINLKLILEDIRRTAEHSSDIAEAALNQTITEIIEPR